MQESRTAAPQPPPLLPDPEIPLRLAFADPHGLMSPSDLGSVGAPAPSATDPRWYALALRAHLLRASALLAPLLAPQALHDRVRPHSYQLRVVERILREMAPAAILADEVGLGKTIEAGLMYKELRLRGVVRSALVLAPKALLSQWQEELRERFDEDFVLTDERRFRGFGREQRVICSLPQFVRAFDRVAARPWDLLIVDEAHLLANPRSKRRQCVARLSARWRLLLTATPVANKLTDLYSLIDLVSPGKLGTLSQFEEMYVADPGTSRVVQPRRLPQLRSVVGEVMCRTRRSDTDIAFSGRSVQTRAALPAPDEDALIADVTDYLRALYRRAPHGPLRHAAFGRGAGSELGRGAASELGRAAASEPGERSGRLGERDPAGRDASGPAAESRPEGATSESRLNRGAVIREIMALQQSLSSSPQAIEQSLRRRAQSHPDERGMLLALAERAQSVASAKEQLLRSVLAEVGSESLLVFTLRLDTASRLRDVARACGREADCYVGALDRKDREALVERFNTGQLDTLIATDAGAEGLNLQRRCHIVVNYDLHWNPMRIEQRIGRVHRLGQPHDVSVYNFVLKDTIDDYVVRLLYQKIGLFTMTIGALETVLAEAQDGEIDVEERILEALLQNASAQEASAELDALGEEMARALTRQRAAESLTAGVLG